MTKQTTIQDQYWENINKANTPQVELTIEAYELASPYTEKEIVASLVSGCGNYAIQIAWKADKAYHLTEYHKGVILGTSIIYGLGRTMKRINSIALAHKGNVTQWHIIENVLYFGDTLVDLGAILDGSFYNN